jgi:hypothetical protein
MNTRKRVEKLLEQARQLSKSRQPEHRLLTCRGKDLQTTLELVDETLDPQDEDVVKRILDFVEEAARTPYIDWSTNEPFRDDEGQIIYEQHHFVDWLQGLQAGSWSLPERMPRVVLE